MKSNFLLQRELKNKIEHGRSSYSATPVHFHSHFEIYIVHSGEVEVFVNGQRRILRDGEICIALSYDSHGYRSISASETEYLIIPRDYCKEILPLLDQREQKSPFISDKSTYELVQNAMKKLFDRPSELSKRALIYLILGAILDHQPNNEDKEESSKSPLFSPDILIYINQHFHEELTLPVLARQFGYNPSYLSRSFKENFGISFCSYIKMLRLREAILLLKSGEASVTKCALESGFGSMRSFYRAFHEEFGVSPKEYFEQNHNNTPQSK